MEDVSQGGKGGIGRYGKGLHVVPARDEDGTVKSAGVRCLEELWWAEGLAREPVGKD
jgi:hypothetical protein